MLIFMTRLQFEIYVIITLKPGKTPGLYFSA
jgi:hypothetical protein